MFGLQFCVEVCIDVLQYAMHFVALRVDCGDCAVLSLGDLGVR